MDVIYKLNGQQVSRARFQRARKRGGSGVPNVAVENLETVSTSMPFLTDAQMRDPSVPKALNYTRDPITGLHHATWRSKQERSESCKRTGYEVYDA